MTRTATTTGEPDREDQTVIYKVTIKTGEGVCNRIRQRTRDTTAREKQSNDTGQHHGRKELFRPRQTDANKRPADFNLHPKFTGNKRRTPARSL